MIGIVITGGKCPPFQIIEELISRASYVVAADSGLDYCRASGIDPHYIIGDMDSLEDQESLNSYPSHIVERHPAEKDFTDTELGLQHVYRQGVDKTVLIGGGGGRADHFLAIYSLYFRSLKPDFWITHNTLFRRIQGTVVFETVPGEQISLFPTTEHCRMESSGLFWPLEELRWKIGDFGISNRATAKEVSIRMHAGELVMVQDLDSAILPS